jgi:ribosomal protein L44E
MPTKVGIHAFCPQNQRHEQHAVTRRDNRTRVNGNLNWYERQETREPKRAPHRSDLVEKAGRA